VHNEEVELRGGKSGRVYCAWPLTCVQAGAGASALSLDLDLARVLLQVSHLVVRVLALFGYCSLATPFLFLSSRLACGCALVTPLPHPQPPSWSLRSKLREAKCPRLSLSHSGHVRLEPSAWAGH
jgi:hypothetical protein